MPAAAESTIQLIMILQHRSLSARRPGPHPMRALAQSAFIDTRSHAPRGGLFFNARPRHPLPAPDRLFIALQCAPARSLAAPVELAQDSPYLRGVILYAALLLDELAHPPQCPQSGCVSQHLRATFERALNRGQLLRTQLGFASGASGLLQSCPAHTRQRPLPTNH